MRRRKTLEQEWKRAQQQQRQLLLRQRRELQAAEVATYLISRAPDPTQEENNRVICARTLCGNRLYLLTNDWGPWIICDNCRKVWYCCGNEQCRGEASNHVSKCINNDLP